MTGRSGRRLARAAYGRFPLKRQLASLLRPLPLRWRWKQRLRFTGTFSVAVDGDHSFRLHTAGGSIENDLFWRGYGRGWERMSLTVWAALVPAANTIIDVGANIGVYALTAASLNPRATIVAFEPLERAHARLVANVSLNGFAIRAEQSAVSDSSGTATLYDQPRDDFHGASLEPPEGAGGDQIQHRVPTVRLDDFCRTNGIDSIDLLKVDVEGHEDAALKGMGALIADGRPTILIEILSDRVGSAVWSMLSPLGYLAYRIEEASGLILANSLTQYLGHDRNYLLCMPDALERSQLERYLLRPTPVPA